MPLSHQEKNIMLKFALLGHHSKKELLNKNGSHSKCKHNSANNKQLNENL